MLSTQTLKKLDLDGPVLIPYDIKCSNSTQSQERFLQFNDTRSIPFLDCPNNYFMTIERFQLQTPKNLPVFIPIIQPNQANVNQTIYTIGIQVWDAGPSVYNSYEAPLIWSSQTLTPAPSAPVGNTQSMIDDYYYCFHYQHFINIINQTLSNINGTIPIASRIPTDKLPWFTLDQSTFNVVLNHSTEWIEFAGSTTIYRIYMNEALYNLFGTFPAVKRTINPPTNNIVWILRPAQKFDSTFDYPNTTTEIFQTPTENTPLSQWNPIESIVFTSNLPLITTNTSAGGIFNSTNFGESGTGSNIANVISSFAVPFNANNSYRAYITYTPTGEYRMYDLISQNPLSQISISVYWSDWFGNLNQFKLDPGCNANISILFRRKDFNMSTRTMLNF